MTAAIRSEIAAASIGKIPDLLIVKRPSAKLH